MQTTFGAILLAIVNGKPQILTLKEMLQNCIDFQCEIIERRTAFDMKKAKERAHILEGLKVALDFIDEVIKENKLEKVKTIHKRAEDAGRDKTLREKFDYATARAVSNMSTLSEYLLPLVKVGGKFIALKGPLAKEEALECDGACRELKLELTEKQKNLRFCKFF